MRGRPSNRVIATTRSKARTINNVRQLFALTAERRETLKQFYAEQAGFFMEQLAKPAGGAAALHIAVTGEGRVETKLAGVDGAHAAVLLAELDRVRAQLVQYLAHEAPELVEKINQVEPDQETAGNVVPLHKAADGEALGQAIALRRR